MIAAHEKIEIPSVDIRRRKWVERQQVAITASGKSRGGFFMRGEIMKMPPGRPRKFDDPEEFAEKIDEYFADILAKGRPPTIAGLCYFLGFCSRQALQEYEKREGFSSAVSRAKLAIERDRSERLALKDEYTPGLPMDLRVNHGWIDTQALEHKHSGAIATESDEQLDARIAHLLGKAGVAGALAGEGAATGDQEG